jgi:2-polyprenyl-3-methyl-5-hydroxy-6-metoxy-1,4-benzoquinol methylase
MYNEAENRFLSLFRELRQFHRPYLESLNSYKYIRQPMESDKGCDRYIDALIGKTRQVIRHVKGKVILDAGCGAGTLSVWCALLGADKVLAVDSDQDSINLTKLLAELSGTSNLIEPLYMDISNINLDKNSIDGMFLIEAISHIRTPWHCLESATNWIRGGGVDLYTRWK